MHRASIMYNQYMMTDDPDAQQRPSAEEIQRVHEQALRYGQDFARVVAAERQRRQELEAAHHLLSTVIASTPNGLIVVDDALVIQQANPAFCDMINISFVKVEGMNLTETPLSEQLVPVLTDGPADQSTLTVDIVRHHPEFQALQASVARLEGSGVQGWVVALHDHTQRTLAEQALQAAHDQLEERVEARTTELQVTNAQLKQEIEERRQAEAAEREQRVLAEALRDTAEVLVSTLDVSEVWDRILSQVWRVVSYDAANIMQVDEQGHARIVRSRGYTKFSTEPGLMANKIPVAETVNLNQMARTGEPIIIPDTSQHPAWDSPAYAGWVRSYLGVPIHSERQVIGFINLDSAQAGYFSEKHGERLLGLADQAAIALKNAELYERAQEVAALEERHQLARDLHDAVSQTLWSAGILADTIPGLWDIDREEGQEALDDLSGLIRGALAEMRTLLLELRPETLTEKKLPDLIRQLAESFTNRTGVPVELNLPADECHLPPAEHVALYRITQEALNNVMKHAAATRVTIHLTCRPDRATLQVVDNGRGFDPARIPSDHFGINIMQERASSIEADFDLQTEPGAGTHIAVTAPLPEEV